MNRCNRIVANVFRKYLSPFSITDSQLSILFVLYKMQTINQKFISEKLFLEKSTVTRNLDRLINNELLVRNNDHTISITNKGIETVNTILPEWEKAMAKIKSLLNEDGESALALIHSRLT